MRKQRGLAIVVALSVMIGMITLDMPAAAILPPLGPALPGGPIVVRSALAWGSNRVGQVGDGTIGGRRTLPVPPFGLDSGVSQVAAGLEFTLAVQNGTVLTEVTRIATGRYHYLAVRSDGTLWSWGDNYSGQLGDGTTTHRRDPVPVLAASGSVEMDAGGNHTIVVVEHHPTAHGGTRVFPDAVPDASGRATSYRARHGPVAASCAEIGTAGT
jgi:hypothetical protein